MGWTIMNGVKRRWRIRMIWRAVDIYNKHGYIYKGVDVDEKRRKVIYKFIKGDSRAFMFDRR